MSNLSFRQAQCISSDPVPREDGERQSPPPPTTPMITTLEIFNLEFSPWFFSKVKNSETQLFK